MIPAVEALRRLREGNRRFVANGTAQPRFADRASRAALMAGQEPFAIILGCSDSRVPAELVFDQGLGDLFVVRVAGNVATPSQIGSVEFAAAQFGTRLVLVLGHTQCGAIAATLEAVKGHPIEESPNLRSIIDQVRPSVERVLRDPHIEDPNALFREAVRQNVQTSANHLRSGSALLKRLIQRDGLLVVGAEYSLETGIVSFFDGAPPGT